MVFVAPLALFTPPAHSLPRPNSQVTLTVPLRLLRTSLVLTHPLAVPVVLWLCTVLRAAVLLLWLLLLLHALGPVVANDRWSRTIPFVSTVSLPGPPENIAVRGVSKHTVSLEWHRPVVDGSAPIDSYVIKCVVCLFCVGVGVGLDVDVL